MRLQVYTKQRKYEARGVYSCKFLFSGALPPFICKIKFSLVWYGSSKEGYPNEKYIFLDFR